MIVPWHDPDEMVHVHGFDSQPNFYGGCISGWQDRDDKPAKVIGFRMRERHDTLDTGGPCECGAWHENPEPIRPAPIVHLGYQDETRVAVHVGGYIVRRWAVAHAGSLTAWREVNVYARTWT